MGFTIQSAGILLMGFCFFLADRGKEKVNVPGGIASRLFDAVSLYPFRTSHFLRAAYCRLLRLPVFSKSARTCFKLTTRPVRHAADAEWRNDLSYDAIDCAKSAFQRCGLS